MEVKNQWADLNALVEEAKVFYLNNPLPDARKAAVILEPIFECLSHQKEYRQMAVYKLESSIEDCEINNY